MDPLTNASQSETLKQVLFEEYKFMQKAYELQFTHFMGVFYLWIGLVTLPTGAGLFKSLDTKLSALGLVCFFVSLLGVFLSTKMFDIRRSQIRYVMRANQIRFALWDIA